MLTKHIGKRVGRNSLLSAHGTSAGGAAVAITIAAATNKRHLVHHVQWSYDTAPTGGMLTITSAGVTKFEVTISAAGPGGFGISIVSGVGEAIVITLAGGGGAVVGKINAQYNTEVDRLEYGK